MLDEQTFIYTENTNDLINPPAVIEKKKRGRKPKNKTLIEPIIDSEQKILKKRGRKTTHTKMINLLNDNNINMDMMNNFIVHLPLKINDIYKIINTQTEELNLEPMPKCVDFTEDIVNLSSNKYLHKNICCSNCINYQTQIKQLEEQINNLKNGIIFNSANFNKKIYESKINLYNKLLNKYEEQTNIACWWCCHSFNNIPLGIPEYINKNDFILSGCFCSFNCMMAYNIDLNDYKIWDRQSNIYQMKNKIDPSNKISIHPAPPRQTLIMFGGPLDINKYRESFFIINKEFRYLVPPMISIIGTIEEDNRNTTNYSQNNKNNHNLLRRTKPLSNKGNKLSDIIQTI